MTLHYHGTPITPGSELVKLAGRCFCVSFFNPQQIQTAVNIGQSVMLDNGAFSAWKQGVKIDWEMYYEWASFWTRCPSVWAVIPDVIDGGAELQDALIAKWPLGTAGAPVWHMDEPIDRLLDLVDTWPLVCMGSTAEYRTVGSVEWRRRMDFAWNEITLNFTYTPKIHMLRGMQTVHWGYPFYSVDSTDIGRNHHRAQNDAGSMAARWDSMQCAPLQKPKTHK